MCVRACAVACLFRGECNHEVFSPPARPLPLETAATLPRGDTGIQAEYGTVIVAEGIGGPEVDAGTVRLRHGTLDKLDLSGELSVARVEGTAAAGTNPWMEAARAGAKWSPVYGVAVMGGLGGGISAAGGFMSPDVGTVFALENPYVVPFISVRGGLSAPIDARAVDTTQRGDLPERYVDRPLLTWIAGFTLGARIPIGRAPKEAGTLRGSLLGGVGALRLADARKGESFITLAMGGEVAF